MRHSRPPAVAGTFYPARAARLSAEVDELLGQVRDDAAAPQALIVPHAGYSCSGPIAGVGYRTIGRRAAVRRVVILGPAHFDDPHGIAFPETAAWSTPLGAVPVDHDLAARLADAGVAHADDRAHRRDHAIEVQLPFLQRLLPEGWTVLPLAVHGTSADEVADSLDLLVDDDVLVVCSTDLSHYYDDPSARRLDRRTADAILARDAEGVSNEQACGSYPLRGVLTWARRHRLAVQLLAQGTSADTCGGRDRVVGYGAFALS